MAQGCATGLQGAIRRRPTPPRDPAHRPPGQGRTAGMTAHGQGWDGTRLFHSTSIWEIIASGPVKILQRLPRGADAGAAVARSGKWALIDPHHSRAEGFLPSSPHPVTVEKCHLPCQAKPHLCTRPHPDRHLRWRAQIDPRHRSRSDCHSRAPRPVGSRSGARGQRDHGQCDPGREQDEPGPSGGDRRRGSGGGPGADGEPGLRRGRAGCRECCAGGLAGARPGRDRRPRPRAGSRPRSPWSGSGAARGRRSSPGMSTTGPRQRWSRCAGSSRPSARTEPSRPAMRPA